MSKAHVDFLLNEEKISIKDLDTNTTVLNYLRNNHELTGTKEGCASGDCGACTAVVGELKENKISYKSINTCITFLYSLHGKQLITVEHIKKNKLHPVQQSMIDSDGSQCGFCTPGIIMSMYNIKNAIKNMYSYKSNKFSKSKVIKLLKSIKKTDIVIKKNDSKFFIHYNLNSLIKDYQKISNGHLLVGGTDLALEVTKKRKDLKNIFYLGSNKDLNYVKNKNNNLHIGSATPINDILPILENIYPTFAKMFERYGSEQIRNTASLGGNIGSASPIGDSLPVLIALNSKIVIQGKVKKTLLLDNYFLSYRKTKLKPNEIIKEIIIPIYKKNILKCYKISKRIDDDISSVFMAINARIEKNIIKEIKIVCGGLAETPKIAEKAQKFLLNKIFNEENINEAKKIIKKEFDPIDDMRASKNYRTKISQNLLERFLNENNKIKSTLY